MARPRKEDARDLRGLAIEASIALLADRDQPELSMAEVARRIGCSAPALYQHFTDRDDLLDAVRRAVIDRVIARKQQRYDRPDIHPLSNLAEGGHTYLSNAAKAPALYRLIYCRPPSSGAPADAISDGALEALTRGVRACQAEGLATQQDPRELARLLWSMVHGAALLALDSAQDQRAAAWEQAHRSVDLAIALIAAPAPRAHGEPDETDTPTRGPDK